MFVAIALFSTQDAFVKRFAGATTPTGREGPVFAGALVEFSQHLDVVELVVAVGVADTIKALGEFAAIDDDVEAVECVEESLGVAEIDVDQFHQRDAGFNEQ